MKKRTGEILAVLDQLYGTDITCFLHAEDAGQLLIAHSIRHVSEMIG